MTYYGDSKLPGSSSGSQPTPAASVGSQPDADVPVGDQPAMLITTGDTVYRVSEAGFAGVNLDYAQLIVDGVAQDFYDEPTNTWRIVHGDVVPGVLPVGYVLFNLVEGGIYYYAPSPTAIALESPTLVWQAAPGVDLPVPVITKVEGACPNVVKTPADSTGVSVVAKLIRLFILSGDNNICLDTTKIPADPEVEDGEGTEGFVKLDGLTFCFTDLETLSDQAYGPEYEGKPDENDYTYVWVLRKTKEDEELPRFVYGLINGETYDATAYILADENPDQISLSFDAAGAPVVAFVISGQMYIRRIQDGDMKTYGPFDADSLQLWYNGILLDYITDSLDRDVVVFYTREGEEKLFVRKQRENFAIEYEIVKNLKVDPKKIFFDITSDFTLYIYGYDTSYRGFIIQSKRYAPFSTNKEKIGLTGGFSLLEYISTIVIEDVTEKIGLTGAFTSLVYFDAVVPYTETDFIGLNGSFSLLDYIQRVMLADASDQIGITGGFVDGLYYSSVVTASASDTVGIRGGFSSGIYQLA